MTADAVQCIYPKGRIHPDMFPDLTIEDLTSNVQGWLDDAAEMERVMLIEDEHRKQRAIVAWAYWRAFDSACTALLANPARTQQVDAGQASYDKDQRDNICALSRQYLLEFEALAPPADGRPPVRTGGRTVHHTFVF